MKNLLLTISILGAITAGCGREAGTAPQPQRSSWTLLSIHFDGDDSADSQIELAVSSTAEVTLRNGWGNVVSSRGLLAGGKLETLTRLVDALPPRSYEAPCAPGYRVRLVRDGQTRSFDTGACDPAAPASVAALAAYFQGMVDELLSPPARAVGYQSLLTGMTCAIGEARRVVVRDRDGLARLLREISPDQPAAVGRVDFRRQMVVADFVGTYATTGYEVQPDGVEVTLGGLMRIRFGLRIPGDTCVTQDLPTQPFVLVAVEARPDDEILFESSTVEVHCE